MLHSYTLPKNKVQIHTNEEIIVSKMIEEGLYSEEYPGEYSWDLKKNIRR